MWKPLNDLPTLTELFFGKGVDPATYKGAVSGKTQPKKKSSKKSITKKKTIQEVKSSTSKAKEKKPKTIAGKRSIQMMKE